MRQMVQKKSKEFEERKTLIELQFKYDTERQKWEMKGVEFRRESDRLHHERELERGRIKSAEIRKTQMRRDASKSFAKY